MNELLKVPQQNPEQEFYWFPTPKDPEVLSTLYNVVNFIITDRKRYRCIFKVSFYFRGSLYEINVLLTLFLQIEVSL